VACSFGKAFAQTDQEYATQSERGPALCSVTANANDLPFSKPDSGIQRHQTLPDKPRSRTRFNLDSAGMHSQPAPGGTSPASVSSPMSGRTPKQLIANGLVNAAANIPFFVWQRPGARGRSHSFLTPTHSNTNAPNGGVEDLSPLPAALMPAPAPAAAQL